MLAECLEGKPEEGRGKRGQVYAGRRNRHEAHTREERKKGDGYRGRQGKTGS